MRTFFFTPNFSSLSLFFLVITNALSSRIRIQRLRIIDCLVYALCTQRYTDSSVSISLSCLREIFHALCASCAISLDYDCAGAERWRTTQLDFSSPPPFSFSCTFILLTATVLHELELQATPIPCRARKLGRPCIKLENSHLIVPDRPAHRSRPLATAVYATIRRVYTANIE